MRTGSSVIGEIFNQNPAFFYIFEPLRQIEKRGIINSNVNFSTGFAKALWATLNCDFTELVKYTTSRRFFKFRSSQHILQFCDKVLQWSFRECASVLQPKVITKLETYCNRIPYSAVKTIRVQNIHSLQHLVNDSTIHLKIIHLVRDPRATFASR
ncbi:carbohydrate sulfotransferase 3-like [Branchiostoma floridae x Branchiostoma belcheri]